jgi:membrane protein implicated in regulation of membrane protease activity
VKETLARAPGRARRAALILAAAALMLASGFFIFYTARLLAVTRGLCAVRAGGHGAYVGAAVFPVLAFLLGWGGWRIARKLRGPRLAKDG